MTILAAVPARDSRSRWRWPALPLAALAALAAARSSPAHAPAPTPLAIEVAATDGARVTVRAADADALWLYCGVERCPGPTVSRTTAGGATLTFLVTAGTRHRVLAVRGAGDLTATGDFDRDVLAARARGARLALRSIGGSTR